MKYIRTKDGIIVDTTKYKTVVERTFNGKVVAIDLNHWGQDNEKYITWIDAENIIKQADTIEELCDEFVVYDFKNLGKDMEHYIFNLESALRILEVQKYYPKNIVINVLSMVLFGLTKDLSM